jgi:hypothetical protein
VQSRIRFLVIAAVLAMGGGRTLAQEPQQASPVSPLTVEGAAPPKVIKERSWSFVQAYTVSNEKTDLVGRWREPICVQVVNLTPEQAAMVKARIEEVARGVGLSSAGPGCRSNIQIVLTGQPQAFLDKVAKNDEGALGFHYSDELSKVKTVTHPIQGWYKTATEGSKVNHDGLPFAVVTTGAVGHNSNGEATTNSGSLKGETHAHTTVDSPDSGTPQGCAGSLINHCLSSVFRNVLVVVDSRAVAGKGLGPLADYLAMMALSQAKSLDGCNGFPSILDLMAKSPCPGRDPPDGITDADASFLTALYSANPEAAAIAEQNDIAGRMAEMLIKSSTSAKAGEARR